MKFVSAQLAFFFRNRTTRRNVRALLRFVAVLVAMMLVFSIIFHFIAEAEGQRHSWVTGLYWTVVTMATLGYGDIIFQSDLGRIFSVVVLLSGVLFLLVLLPFAFIQFFYAPWIEAQSQMRAPRELPEGTRDHVILTRYDPVTMSLIPRLVDYGHPYVLLEGDMQRALELYDQGIHVVLGDVDDIETYRRIRAADAAMVVASDNDFLNSSIAFTVRELTDRVPIVATVRAPESIDVLELAGSSHVLQLAEMLGRSLARRTLGGDTRASIIGRFDGLLIAEAPATGTPLVGRTLRESNLRKATGVNVVGVWERGSFEIPGPETRIGPHTVLVLAGSEEQLQNFDALICIYSSTDAPVLILGGGRVGRAAARALQEREVVCRIVEKNPERVRDVPDLVIGSAAELEVLERAGIREAPSTLVTTNDDATNIYLTIYCRRLRPDMQIVSRATLERNVSTLHRAGADFVMSYASMGANAIFNVLERDDVVMLAEGLDVFRYPAPAQVVGRPLGESRIRETTGCSVVAVENGTEFVINPPPETTIPASAVLILIGTTDGERRFIQLYRR
ncbi:MAG: potassium channel protein [Gemmatimonadetes bacterium]|nr:potassium channel protein [Gemmatimonadota bacterium]